ncbi:hypothetical protein ANO11243_016880 [Dothideomycetidae sp. 11243]|nr:hypothetical protein ANO11243_016880 [fungal sp. No.11243]
MAAVSDPVVIYNLVDVRIPPQRVAGSVIAANAYATTILLNCGDWHGCGYNTTLTIGPWAQVTPAPGVPNIGVQESNEFSTVTVRNYWGTSTSTSSFTQWGRQRCEVTDYTVPTACTFAFGGPGDPTTYTVIDPTTTGYVPTQVRVTITAGFDLLPSANATWISSNSTGTDSGSNRIIATLIGVIIAMLVMAGGFGLGIWFTSRSSKQKAAYKPIATELEGQET